LLQFLSPMHSFEIIAFIVFSSRVVDNPQFIVVDG
jgi:hypothetical protein